MDFNDTSTDLRSIRLYDTTRDPNNYYSFNPSKCRLACAIKRYVEPLLRKLDHNSDTLENGEPISDALGRCVLSKLGLREASNSPFVDMEKILKEHPDKRYRDLAKGVAVFERHWSQIASDEWNWWYRVHQND